MKRIHKLTISIIALAFIAITGYATTQQVAMAKQASVQNTHYTAISN
tara:strand:- start:13363 stop:13503 length:141 start_codon:yes stop_codon:yes gene_type:complete